MSGLSFTEGGRLEGVCFSPSGRMTIFRAVTENQRNFHDPYLGTHHLLLGMLLLPPPDPAYQVLRSFGVDLTNLRKALIGAFGVIPADSERGISLSGLARRVLLSAEQERLKQARQQPSVSAVGSEHILLALTALPTEGGGIGYGSLQAMGLDLSHIRLKMLRDLPGQPLPKSTYSIRE